MKVKAIWFTLGVVAAILAPWLFGFAMSSIAPHLPLSSKNEVISTAPSLDGDWVAVTFARHGWAGAQDTVDVSVLKSGGSIHPSSGGNQFRVQASHTAGSSPVVKTVWDTEGRLLIHYDKEHIVTFASEWGPSGPVFYRHLHNTPVSAK